jgi:hypothetical protein
MKTRTGKIARLPLALREQLNQRLQNGELGSALLHWLNQLPEVKEVLAQQFASQPITKQNLSEWKHGGYEDWLRHQSRQQWIQRVTEQGNDLDCPEDLYECFSRILIAEMSEELESLHHLTNRDQRWQRLQELSRELARLQHSFNNSKRVELAYLKREDLFEDEAEEPVDQSLAKPPAESTPVQPSPSESLKKEPVKPADPPSAEPPKPIQRYIYHRHCGRDCICPDCHPADGDYPYAEALADYAAIRATHSNPFPKGDVDIWVFNTNCDCYCGCEKTPAWEGERLPGAVNPDGQLKT